MKKLILLIPIILTACAGPMGSLGRLFPDGASGNIDEITVNASMTGAGSIILKGVRWTGTNGFPIPGTNTTITLPAGSTLSTPGTTIR